jgi:tetratricopeptide (TPR) repeat protein
MPPWKPVPGHADYANDRSLTAQELESIERWVTAGAPAGDRQRIPPPPVWPVGWQLGEPDLVVRLAAPYALPADGRDVYRNFVIRPPPGGKRYVAAWEFRPGSRTVHHAILNIDRQGWARRKDAEDAEPGYPGMDPGLAQSPDGFYLVWTPGKTPTPPAPGTAWTLDDGTDLVLQLHLQPSGKPEQVAPVIALHFTREPPTRPRLSFRIGDLPLDIPPGAKSYRIADQYTFAADAALIGLFPHAHYLATRMRCQLRAPDGSARWLLYIDDWDFNWQEEYVFAQPVQVARGSTVSMEFFYDNSADNPRNPFSPPRRVRTGEQSTDEMGNITLQLAVTAQNADILRESKYRRRLEAGDARGEFNLGNALLRQGKLEEAIAHYRRALAYDPALVVAHVNLATALTARGSPAEAVGHCERALKLRPSDAVALATLGQAYEAQGQRERAAAEYRKALEIDPASAAARGGLARVGRTP